MNEELPDKEAIQSLVERFHKAEWLDGISMVSEERTRLQFTQHGLWRMRQLFAVFSQLPNDLLQNESNPSTFKLTKVLLGHYSDAISDLVPPALSRRERNALIGIAFHSGKRYRWL